MPKIAVQSIVKEMLSTLGFDNSISALFLSVDHQKSWLAHLWQTCHSPYVCMCGNQSNTIHRAFKFLLLFESREQETWVTSSALSPTKRKKCVPIPSPKACQHDLDLGERWKLIASRDLKVKAELSWGGTETYFGGLKCSRLFC